MNVMNRLDKRFEMIAGRVTDLDKLIGSGDLPSASRELKSVINDLMELKSEEVHFIQALTFSIDS